MTDYRLVPVAYAVFADNGNIRIWCADPIQAETLRMEYGDELKPLYATPQPVEQQAEQYTAEDMASQAADAYRDALRCSIIASMAAFLEAVNKASPLISTILDQYKQALERGEV